MSALTRKIVCVLLACLFAGMSAVSLSAQRRTIPQKPIGPLKTHKGAPSFGDSPTDLGVMATFHVRGEKFLNSNFNHTFEPNGLSQHGGIEWSIMVPVYHHVMLEAEAFLTDYEVDSDVLKSIVYHTGIEAYADFFVLPDTEFDSILAPYVGIGYLTSSLRTYDNSVKSSVGTGGPMAKAGLLLFLGDNTYFEFTYKQGLALKSDKLFRSIEVGLGLPLNKIFR